MTRRRAIVVMYLLLLSVLAGGCLRQAPSMPLPGGHAERVLVIGVGGVTWDEILEASPPAMLGLARGGGVGNISVRVTNRAAESYVTLGSGQRTQVSPAGGWAFDIDETVENGSAIDLYRRRSGLRGRGEVVVASIDQISRANLGRGFDARPGLLAELIEEDGGATAVLGNTDLGLGPLPSRFPDLRSMSERDPPENGIHRDAALAAMRSDGTVAMGAVSRAMLEGDPNAPFGVSTSLNRLTQEFDRVWESSKLVVIETGDSSRADSYVLGVAEDVKERVRTRALFLVDKQIERLLSKIDRSTTLVVVFAPTTPGGVTERGQLRPVILNGPGIPQGTLVSPSTRRTGLITMPDVTAAIGFSLGLSPTRLAAGRVPAIDPEWSLDRLADMNQKAVVHDHLRAPLSIVVIGLQLLVYLIALAYLRRGQAAEWMSLLLLSGLAFPVASYITHTPIWRMGEFASGAFVILTTVVCALVARLSMRRFVHGDVLLLLILTFVVYAADLITGANLQLDSIFGYSSVAGGRFYGLGNLGFALMTASAFLVAGMLASKGRRWTWAGLALVLLAIILDGHPRLGGDVGGILALVPGGLLFAYSLLAKRRIQRRHWPVLALAAIAVVLVFGAIDLARPVTERSHFGDFLATVWSQPSTALLVIRRKASLALSLAIANYWGAIVPAAVAVLVSLNLRRNAAWTQQIQDSTGIRAGLEALIVVAIIGSVLNDSGLAIAGMMLALATPWALLIAWRPTRSQPGT